MRQNTQWRIKKHDTFSDKCDVVNVKNVNPCHTKFYKWNNPPSIFGTIHLHF